MQILSEIFSLCSVKVYKYSKTSTKLKIRVASVKKVIPCTHCGCLFNKYGCKHSTGQIKEYQHGRLDEREVILIARRNKYCCPHCNRITTEPLGSIKLGCGHCRTFNYDNLVLQQLAFSPNISNVAKKLGLTDDKVRLILTRNTSRGPWINQNLEKISNKTVLGIDEKHWLKKQYHLVVTSITDKLLLALGRDRRKQTLLELLKAISRKITPRAVCIDMWAAFRNAVKEIFGEVPIIVDKFHVFSFVNRKIIESRAILEFRRKQKGIENYSLPSFRPLLLSRKNFNRSKRCRELYKNLIKLEPELKFYRDIRNRVEDMYNLKDRYEAEKALDSLIKFCWHSPCSHGIDIAKTLDRWFKEITNYFDFRYTNAYTEGINNKLELINRSGFGYRNKEIYLRRASLLVK